MEIPIDTVLFIIDMCIRDVGIVLGATFGLGFSMFGLSIFWTILSLFF